MLSDLDTLPQVQLGDYLLRFELDDLTEFGKQVAAKELRETDEVKREAIAELRELLKGNSAHFLFQTTKFIHPMYEYLQV